MRFKRYPFSLSIMHELQPGTSEQIKALPLAIASIAANGIPSPNEGKTKT